MMYLLIVLLMSGGRGRAMVFSYQSIPLGACVSRFLQQVYEFFMTNVESMDYTHSHPSTIVLDNIVAVLRRSPATGEHQDRHHAIVLTELSLEALLDRSSWDVTELNMCRTRRCRAFGT